MKKTIALNICNLLATEKKFSSLKAANMLVIEGLEYAVESARINYITAAGLQDIVLRAEGMERAGMITEDDIDFDAVCECFSGLTDDDECEVLDYIPQKSRVITKLEDYTIE